MRFIEANSVGVLVLFLSAICQLSSPVDCGNVLSTEPQPSSILIVTMGGTPSHKIPLLALAKGLIAKNHRVTLLSGYPPKETVNGLEEIVPKKFMKEVSKYDDYDYLGTRIRVEVVKNLWDAITFAIDSCNALLTDPELKQILDRKFDLMIIDSFFPECLLGIAEFLQVPFMYFNTMTNYLTAITAGGSPAPWSITPCFLLPFTNRMSFFERIHNSLWFITSDVIQRFILHQIHRMQKKVLSNNLHYPLEIAKNVSFVLQNGHSTISHSQPFLQNVAMVGGIHCRPAKPLPKALNDYLDASDEQGFIYVSMGTSVNPKTMPLAMLKIFLAAFSKLPYRILWKFDTDLKGLELPANVRIESWLPQQDVLGHKNIKAFVSHSGIFGTVEAIYHGVPIVTLPVFGDQESNAAKVVEAGYGLRIELRELTVDELVASITEVAEYPQYRTAVERARKVLLDQSNSPLDTAVYWTEYVIRHKGATHFYSTYRDLNWFQLYSYDTVLFLIVALAFIYKLLAISRRYSVRIISGKYLAEDVNKKRKLK